MARKIKEWDLRYLNQQYSAMRWLAKQGLTPSEIREFRWGQVDEADKTITVRKKIINLKYDMGKKSYLMKDEDDREVKIDLRGSEHEWFFLKSKILNFFWVFTAYPPKSWRKEEGRESLFPLEVVERCCRDISATPVDTSLLTFIDGCANIEISKLNIQKQESEELVEGAIDAEIVTEAND